MPLLAAHFARRAGVRLAGAPLTPSAADTEMLLAYAWPGNVRELAAVIERAAILGRGHRLESRERSGWLPSVTSEPHRPRLRAGDPLPEDTLDAAMRRHVESALQASAGRIEGPQGAARRLGVNPHTLRGRMRRLGITWKAYRRPRTGDASAGAAPAGAAPAGGAPATPGTSGPPGSTRRCMLTSKPPSRRPTAESKDHSVRPLGCGSIRTRCARACGSWASTVRSFVCRREGALFGPAVSKSGGLNEDGPVALFVVQCARARQTAGLIHGIDRSPHPHHRV